MADQLKCPAKLLLDILMKGLITRKRPGIQLASSVEMALVQTLGLPVAMPPLSATRLIDPLHPLIASMTNEKSGNKSLWVPNAKNIYSSI